MPGSNVYISSGGATGGAVTNAVTTAATNASGAASNAATATGSAGAGVMPYVGAGVGLLNTINTAINNAQISDTLGYRDYYDAFGSLLYDGDFNALVNQRKNSYLKAAPTWRQIRGMTTGLKTASHISSAASGAMAGAGFGPWGAAIGAGIGFLGSFLGAEAGDAKAKEEAANLAILRREALADNQAAFVQGMKNATSVANHQAMANLTAFGGMLDTVDPTTPIGYSLYADDYVRKQNKVNNSFTGNTLFSGMPNNAFAFGGETQTHGGIWNSGLTHINAGGTHEENPYDGVQVGVDTQGVPNLVEENEVIYDDYVFSDRLIVPRGKRGNYGKRNKYAKGGKMEKGRKNEDVNYDEQVLKPFVGLTFAEAAKKAEKQSGVTDRPNDPIAQRGFEATLAILATQQEKEREKEKLAEMQEAIDNMTPEELAMLQQQMAANQQQADEQAMALQQQMIPQGMEQLQEQPEEQQPIAALGGLLNSENEFKYGGNLEKFTNELRNKGLTIEDYLDYYASTQNKDRANLTVTDANFNKDVAEQYLKHVDKAQREVARKYKQEGLNPKNLTGAGLEAYQRDVVAAARGTSVTDGDLSINGFSSSNSGDAKVNDFNRYSYTRNTRLNLIAGGATELKPNAQGQFDINYGIENPTGLTYVEGMPKWNTSSQQWEDAEGKKIDNPFGEGTKFSDVTGGGYNSAFENQDALSQYYKDQIAKRFQNLKGENYNADRLPNYYLSKEELGNWITDLEGSNEAKDRELARMLRANWNLDADNLVESDAYLGLPATQENRLQRDKKPGIEHIPYLDAVPYSGVRYREVDTKGNPTDNYVNWDPANPTAGFSVIEQPLSTEGGVTTYGIRRNALGDNVGVLPDGTYVNLTPDQATLYANNKIADPSALPQYTAPLAGYDHNATYYDLSKDAAGNPLGVKKGTDNDPFPKAPSWPYLAGIGLQSAGLAYNILSPANYSNADAMIAASKEAGIYDPIRFTPIGNYMKPYKFDKLFYANQLAAQSAATRRAIRNNSNGNRATAIAGLLGADKNALDAMGNMHRQAEEFQLKADETTEGFNKDTNKFNAEGFLKADMSNQDAATRARGYRLEGLKSGYAMRQAIDDAKANAISAGISGLGTLLYNYAGNKYNQDILGWGIRHGAYAPQATRSSKGGKLRTRRRKGLSF